MTGRRHAWTDRAIAATGLLRRDRSKFFADSLDSLPLTQQVIDVDLDASALSHEGIHEFTGHSPLGDLDPAYLTGRWRGPDHPSLILHHGNNERAFEFGRTAKNFLAKAVLSSNPPDVNVFVVRAPFHGGPLREYTREVRSLARFTAMLATSVTVTDRLVRQLRASGSPHIAVSGLSLGGWVTNLHRALHNTADVYLPIFAGAALDEVFLSSAYRRLTSRRSLEHPEQLRRVLNFEREFAAVQDDNVRALLARHDQFINFDRQRRCYRSNRVEVLDKGHSTGALATKALRTHVISHLEVAGPTSPR